MMTTTATTVVVVVLVDAAVPPLLKQVDEVHVITSLMGFEALLRGVAVCTYGAPFYAGWGLTDDAGGEQGVFARRTRSRSLDELVAVALLLYPLYVGVHTRERVTAERALKELQKQLQRASPKALGIANSLVQRLLRRLLAWGARFQRRF